MEKNQKKKKENVCVCVCIYICLNHFAVYLKLTQYFKSTYFNLKKRKETNKTVRQ